MGRLNLIKIVIARSLGDEAIQKIWIAALLSVARDDGYFKPPFAFSSLRFA